MRPFAYARPETISELQDALASDDQARVLCGGTDLVVRLRSGHTHARVVVDVKHVRDLSDGIVDTGAWARVGARATMTTLGEDALVCQHFPALVEAANVVGSVQIRNRATLAGNICNASPAADTAPALLVYGAVVNALGPVGPRQIPIGDFFVGPGKTALAPREFVESIDLPIPAAPAGSAFARITRRYGVDLATVNLCCRVDASGDVRFAYGAVAPTPFLASTDERFDVAHDDARQFVAPLVAQTRPISDVRGSADYRTAMVEVMSRRALELAAKRLRARRGDAT